jgi:SulP family sulfate permease
MPDESPAESDTGRFQWRRFVPLAQTLRGYRRTDLQADVVAGLVLGVMTVPQAIAYAFLAGLPPEAGLYASLLPMLVYALLGTSRQMVVGPVAVAALMVAATIANVGPRHEIAPLGLATVLSLETGAFLLLLRVTQLGGIVNLISHPVITGFINAAAILIIVNQLGPFLGIDGIGAGNPFDTLTALAERIGSVNVAAIAIGAGSLALLWLVRNFAARIVGRFVAGPSKQSPWTRIGPILAVATSIALVAAFGLDTLLGVATVGEVPAGMPGLSLPPFGLALWRDLAPSAAMIALVVYVESYTVGTSIATRNNERLDPEQELLALGAANLSAAFTGASPVAGSFSRSSVNVDAGARTPVSGLFSMMMVVATLLLFTPLFENLPQATLAAIIIVSVAGLMDLSSLARHWRISRPDAYTEIVTLVTVLLFSVEVGLVTGVLLSIVLFIRASSRPHLALVGRVADSAEFRSTKRHEVQTVERVAAIRIDENIYFANANYLEGRLQRIVRRRPGTRDVLLIFTGINLVDVSGIEMLSRFNRNLAQVGLSLHVADVKSHVMRQLESGGLPASLSGKVFATTDQALRALAS